MPDFDPERTCEQLFALPKRKAVEQYDETLGLTEFTVRIVSYHTVDNKICSMQLSFQVSDNAGDTISKISICNASPELLKSIGNFLDQVAKKFDKL